MKYPALVTRDIVALPHSEVKIEAGRQSSLAVIEYIQDKLDRSSKLGDKNDKKNNQIVICTQIDSLVENPKLKDIYTTATLCEITSIIKNTSLNTYTVVVKGIERVVIDDLIDDGYLIASVELAKESHNLFTPNSKKITELKKVLIDDKFITSRDVAKQAANVFDQNSDVGAIADLIGNLITNIDLVKYKSTRRDLLVELNVSKRLDILISFINLDAISDDAKKEIDQQINKKVTENLSNHQKEYYLREKIRVVKDEIGKINPKESDLSGFKNKLESNPYPEIIKERIQSEIDKIEGNGFSQENAISKTYIEWLLNLPYWQLTEDNYNLAHAQKILDDSHYGLDKIKERIIEFLAVQERNPKGKATILCLVGPPGVGKTSLAKSIAEALGKKFVKVALGGVHDESEIRGHRRTYLGSMPGRIIKGMKQAGSVNPLFLLDEIDKMSNDGHHGDPASALLEVLDPEQNSTFSDNYVEELYDLSKVFFIATANYIEQIPAPLLDRLEIIELSSYSENEKLSIAKNYLIKKMYETANLSSKNLTFTDDGIKTILHHYTRESGVRELDRQINKIARKLAVKLQTHKDLKLNVTSDVVKEYLGKIIYDYNVKDEKPLPGVVNGMAYTTAGGDLLPIEVTYFPGKANIIITGNLKETMQESAKVALGFVKANSDKFGIPKELDFNNIDIHIHVPSGGVPKDGPSAGVTLTTALISALSKRVVSNNIAMTGEITLRGRVGVIGGVKEKILSAFRGGVSEFYIPKEDERYLEDVPKEVRDKITVHLIEHYFEIYNALFGTAISNPKVIGKITH